MFYYAQLDGNNICIGISQLSGEVNNDSFIRIDNADNSLLGKKYNDGIWEDVEPEPQESPFSETEQAILQTAITTEYMAALMEISR